MYLRNECANFYNDFCFYLSKLQCVTDSAKTPHNYILGGFNADILTTSIFGAELIEFCDNNSLCFLDKNFLPPASFSYISQAHGTTSWSDRCITTTSGRTSSLSIIENIVCSDHFHLCINIVCAINPLCDIVIDIKCQLKIKWLASNEFDKQLYSIISTDKLASTLLLQTYALLCKNFKCTMHHNDIDCLFFFTLFLLLKYLLVTVYLLLPPLLSLIILFSAGMNI